MSALADSSASADSLADDFSALWRDDPIMNALFEGKISWGDILCTPEEEERCRLNRELRQAEEDARRALSAEEDAILLAEHTARGFSAPRPRVTFSEKPAQAQQAQQERVVPEFTPGIRTLMAKNLPRDINVQELRSIFEKYGAIRDIYIPKNMDKSSPYFGTIKGFAKIQFLKSDDSATAYTNEWSRVTIRTKNIVLEFAKEDR